MKFVDFPGGKETRYVSNSLYVANKKKGKVLQDLLHDFSSLCKLKGTCDNDDVHVCDMTSLQTSTANIHFGHHLYICLQLFSCVLQYLHDARGISVSGSDDEMARKNMAILFTKRIAWRRKKYKSIRNFRKKLQFDFSEDTTWIRQGDVSKEPRYESCVQWYLILVFSVIKYLEENHSKENMQGFCSGFW